MMQSPMSIKRYNSFFFNHDLCVGEKARYKKKEGTKATMVYLLRSPSPKLIPARYQYLFSPPNKARCSRKIVSPQKKITRGSMVMMTEPTANPGVALAISA